jgi:hypothetical protein
LRPQYIFRYVIDNNGSGYPQNCWDHGKEEPKYIHNTDDWGRGKEIKNVT